jgi:pyruvate/2-oxoglutarate dehydrogenase complex dihydrolipoamide acyltransferase (E2) component
VHGLIEADVTIAREYIRRHQENTGEKISFTAFVIYCLSRAIEKNPHVHAYRNWRNQLVIFEDVNINSMVEIERKGRRVPIPKMFTAVNRMTLIEIHNQFRSTKKAPSKARETNFMKWFLILPGFIRRSFYWITLRIPQPFRGISSPVMVTAVGMFGKGGGWGIPVSNFTTTVTVGGISRKPGVVEDRIETREFVDLTISIDHDVVDGAPIARFVNDFRNLIEIGYGLLSETAIKVSND